MATPPSSAAAPPPSPPPFPPPFLPIPQAPHSIRFRLRQAPPPRRHRRPAPPRLIPPPRFDPLSQKWTRGPSLSAPRRWCAAGALGMAVYVASGIGSHYDTDVAKSVEKWELDLSAPANPKRSDCFHNDVGRRRRSWKWERLAKLRDAKFSREAIDAIGWRGKLCMVNVRGEAAKEGIIYDVGRDSWEEMPEGMLTGWRGPAAAMAEETMYVVEESKGWLKKYDDVKDAWVEVVEHESLKGAQQVVAAGGRVCVLCADGLGIAVVDVAAPPPARVWPRVEVPSGFQAVGIHVLPRLSHSDD